MDKESLQLRRLGENDRVTAFDCGDEDLNDFILTDAPLYYRVRLATSYVLEDGITGEVAGYFSLAHDRISLTDFPSNSAYNRFRKQFFAQGKMFKSYPALKICRLATNKSAKGMGIGSMMLHTVIESYSLNYSWKSNWFSYDSNAYGVTRITVNGHECFINIYEQFMDIHGYSCSVADK